MTATEVKEARKRWEDESTFLDCSPDPDLPAALDMLDLAMECLKQMVAVADRDVPAFRQAKALISEWEPE